jgi:hypothetical protein
VLELREGIMPLAPELSAEAVMLEKGIKTPELSAEARVLRSLRTLREDSKVVMSNSSHYLTAIAGHSRNQSKAQ